MHTNVDAEVASMCCEYALATEGLLATTANKKDPVSSIPELCISISASTTGTKEIEFYDLELSVLGIMRIINVPNCYQISSGCRFYLPISVILLTGQNRGHIFFDLEFRSRI